ncbi:MAG: LamG domain-containing protein, partial [Planctomycetota bacterium]
VLLLDNSQREVSRIRYGVGDEWPVAPDGSGVSLAKLDYDLGSEDPVNWTSSDQVGGTPGRVNFTDSDDGPAPPIADGLVSFWSFDEGSGSARDASGGNDGTLGSGADRVAGLVGSGALSFDNSSNAFVNIGNGNDDNFSVTTGITVEALIVPEYSGAFEEYDQIFRKEDGSRRILFGFQNDDFAETRDVAISPSTQPVLSFGLNVGGDYSELDMPLDGVDGRPTLAELKDGEFHHVAATYSRATGVKAIYVDGQLAFSASLGASQSASSGGVATAYIGNMSGRREPFDGTIDEVAFWDRALSGAEIAAHFAAVSEGNDYFSATVIEIDESTSLAFNETNVVEGDSWIEVLNNGGSTVPLDGFILESQGTVDSEVELSGTLAPGEFLVLDEAALGFELAVQNRLFLYDPNKVQVFAAVRLKEGLRGRSPDGTGPWLFPDTETPGAVNSFAFRDEIVINEIMYHRRPEPAIPAVVDESDLLDIDAIWRYDASGDGYTTSAWRQPGFDDADWPQGEGALYNEDSDIDAPKGTQIPLGAIVFYFRSTFEFDGEPEGVDLRLRPIIDDGAVFYLNGVELYRHNMAGGPVDPSTFASVAVGNAAYAGPFTVPAPSLRRGTNTIA